MSRLSALLHAYATRALDPYGLIGGRGYEFVGLDSLEQYSIAQAKSLGIEATGGDESSNVVLAPARRTGPPLRIQFGAGAKECLIAVGPDCTLSGDITIHGPRANIFLNGGMPHGGAIRVQIWNAGQTLFVGHRCTTNGNLYVLGGEGRAIIIGEDCMFAANIALRTADLHALIDMTTGARLNPNADIVLEPHVWLGDHVIVGKGVCLRFGSVVGARSFVNKSFPRFSMVAGTPAKLLRRDVCWNRHGEAPPGFVARMRGNAERIPEFEQPLRR